MAADTSNAIHKVGLTGNAKNVIDGQTPFRLSKNKE
jgi:hypothetical protein